MCYIVDSKVNSEKAISGDEVLCLTLNPHPGDANLNGEVGVDDLGILAFNWEQTNRLWGHADFTGDGTVDVSDLGVLAFNWGWTVGEKGGDGGEPINWDVNNNGKIDEEDAKAIFEKLLK